MSRRMKKYKEGLCFLGTCKKNQRQNFIRQASSEIINALGDAIKTLLAGNLPISTYYRNKLRKDIGKLKLLSSKGGVIKKKTVSSKSTRWIIARNDLERCKESVLRK